MFHRNALLACNALQAITKVLVTVEDHGYNGHIGYGVHLESPSCHEVAGLTIMEFDRKSVTTTGRLANGVALRILYDHQVFASQRWGGVSRYFAELAQGIARTETVAVHAPIYLSKCLESIPRDLVRGMRFPEFPGVRGLANVVARLARTRAPFDVFHPTWYGKAGWKPAGAVVAHTVYDLIAELFPEDHWSYPIQAAAKKLAISQADLVFCISESTKSDLIGVLGVDPAKIVVTHLGSSIQLLAPHTPPMDYPYILYVGQRTGYKNFLSLLEAFRSSSNLQQEFGLVCFGGGAFSQSERADIGNLMGRGRGLVSNLQGDDRLLAGAYRAAAVFVCPSRYEGFGMPVLEAMACACPVVATPISSLPEVGGDAVMYSQDESAEALRYAIEALVQDSAALVQAKTRGLSRARQFSWDATTATTLVGYRSRVG